MTQQITSSTDLNAFCKGLDPWPETDLAAAICTSVGLDAVIDICGIGDRSLYHPCLSISL
ncbi:hypothetical protein [cf. Phormidesmis sp. LEGE 11477]|uniref:hypothetical protein n=1 Tax=cf. Phormidesmis sp. LEGE 11477 TaxID=1828680 RepID=UPI001881321D|nr:hypothetical protein [cf. Phormidesmis sp. LEGE 11477]MBE9060217.1 hypothetical protein [cf. Phormidesmis sp. LEGE 11477]